MTTRDHHGPDHRTRPGERLVTQFTREQRGWAAALIVAFLGVAFGGPALTRAGHRRRQAQRRFAEQAGMARFRVQQAGTRAGKTLRRLGGGRIWR